MKRRDLLKHLRRHGCQFVREGAEHSICCGFINVPGVVLDFGLSSVFGKTPAATDLGR
jgi:hypothetical protein